MASLPFFLRRYGSREEDGAVFVARAPAQGGGGGGDELRAHDRLDRDLVERIQAAQQSAVHIDPYTAGRTRVVRIRLVGAGAQHVLSPRMKPQGPERPQQLPDGV